MSFHSFFPSELALSYNVPAKVISEFQPLLLSKNLHLCIKWNWFRAVFRPKVLPKFYLEKPGRALAVGCDSVCRCSGVFIYFFLKLSMYLNFILCWKELIVTFWSSQSGVELYNPAVLAGWFCTQKYTILQVVGNLGCILACEGNCSLQVGASNSVYSSCSMLL